MLKKFMSFVFIIALFALFFGIAVLLSESYENNVAVKKIFIITRIMAEITFVATPYFLIKDTESDNCKTVKQKKIIMTTLLIISVVAVELSIFFR